MVLRLLLRDPKAAFQAALLTAAIYGLVQLVPEPDRERFVLWAQRPEARVRLLLGGGACAHHEPTSPAATITCALLVSRTPSLAPIAP